MKASNIILLIATIGILGRLIKTENQLYMIRKAKKRSKERRKENVCSGHNK